MRLIQGNIPSTGLDFEAEKRFPKYRESKDETFHVFNL